MTPNIFSKLRSSQDQFDSCNKEENNFRHSPNFHSVLNRIGAGAMDGDDEVDYDMK